jgi:alpha-galactosidase
MLPGAAMRAPTIATSGSLGVLTLGIVLVLSACSSERASFTLTWGEKDVAIDSRVARFVVTPSGQLRTFLKVGGRASTLVDDGISGTLQVAGVRYPDAVMALSERDSEWRATGQCHSLRLRGAQVELGLAKTMEIELCADAPGVALVSTHYTNVARTALRLERLSLQSHRLDARHGDPGISPYALWSFQGASDLPGEESVLALQPGFSRPNVMGLMREKGRGGGLPLVAFWNGQVGLALGHAEPSAEVVAIPVRVAQDGRVDVAIEMVPLVPLAPGQTLRPPRTFVAAFQGDYYEALAVYADLLRRQGRAPEGRWPPQAYESSWSSWGYRTDLSPQRIAAVIPALKALGIKRAALDEGWFDAYGDWRPRRPRFNEGDLRRLVSEFHREGLRLDIYWVPLGAELGQLRHDGTHFSVSRVATEHPEWLIRDASGEPASFVRRLAALCPALPEVREYHRRLVERFLGDWDFDGQKLDNAFTVPACYDPRHQHSSPYDSIRAMGDVYRDIHQAAQRIKPGSLTQVCPCATMPNLSWLPYMDQSVAADPWSAAQVRQRIKIYKALFGPTAPVSGDHVEMTGRENTPLGLKMLGWDFGSTIGLGGVVGTRFVWPDGGPETEDVNLTPAKREYWRKWLGLYVAKRLSEGRFRSLYVHGYDLPEAYCVERDGRQYYAFFAPQAGVRWTRPLELRGLLPRRYRVFDYANDRDLGSVRGPTAELGVEFTGQLLLEATPQ